VNELTRIIKTTIRLPVFVFNASTLVKYQHSIAIEFNEIEMCAFVVWCGISKCLLIGLLGELVLTGTYSIRTNSCTVPPTVEVMVF